jgi:hypothetical protein
MILKIWLDRGRYRGGSACYAAGDAYEVEFVTAAGRTIAVLPLALNDVRLMKSKEILHVRNVR